MNELWTGQSVLSHLTLKCDIDHGSNHTVLAHCTPSHDGEHLCQIILISASNEWVLYHIWFEVWHWPWPDGFCALLRAFWQCTCISGFKSFHLKMTNLCSRQSRRSMIIIRPVFIMVVIIFDWKLRNIVVK